MANDSGRVMRRKNPYVMMDVTSLRDDRLSWKAKGLMTYFLDKPEDWKFMMKAIYNASTDGETSVRAGLKELQKYGYLVRVAFRRNKKVSHYEFLIYEQPVGKPSTKAIHIDYDKWNNHLEKGGSIDITLFGENQQTGNLKTGNQNSGFGDTLLSINNTKELKPTINKQQHSEKNVVVVRKSVESKFDKKLTKKQATDLILLAEKHEVDLESKIENTHKYHTQVEKCTSVVGAIKYAIKNGDWEIPSKARPTLPKAVAKLHNAEIIDESEYEAKRKRVLEKMNRLG